jgi:wyosine [tRNA(Phe)-imidazoG37] synthetase (radical SAM superfamily)
MDSEIATEEFKMFEEHKLQTQRQINKLTVRVDTMTELFYKKINHDNVTERLENMEKGIVSLKKKQDSNFDLQLKYIHCYCTLNSLVTLILSTVISVYLCW